MMQLDLRVRRVGKLQSWACDSVVDREGVYSISITLNPKP